MNMTYPLLISNITDVTLTSGSQYNLPWSTWAIYQTFSIILALVAFYIQLVLIHFSCVKNAKWFKRRRRSSNSAARMDKENGENSSSLGVNGKARLNSSEGSHKKKRSDGHEKAARPLRILCLFAAFFAVARMSSDQLELATYGGERIECKTYQVAVIVTYALSATCNYSALWIRLRIFFNHSIMKHLASFSINFLIWLALALILGSSLLNTLIFVLTVMSVDSPKGCVLGETTSISPTLRYIILTLTTVASQGMLLGLFLYPLLKHRTSMKSNPPEKRNHPRVLSIVMQASMKTKKRFPTESDSDVGIARINNDIRSFRRSKQVKRERRLLLIMYRVLITALICSVSDIIAAVVTIAFAKEPRVVTNMVFNFNLLINLFSVLFSFRDWKERIVPCCASKKQPMKKKCNADIAKRANEVLKEESGNNNDIWRPCIDSAVNPVPSSPLESSKQEDALTDSRDDMAMMASS